MRAAFRSRLRLVLVSTVLVALLIIVRLYYVQVIHGEDYALKAERQYVSSGSTLFDRGSIYFTRKDGTLVSAASLATGFVVAINPKIITNLGTAYEAINAAASNTVTYEVFQKATRSSAVYVEVAHHLNDTAGKALAAQKIPGVMVLRERWRIYPAGVLAAQSIGTVSLSADDDVRKGRTGIEARYDEVLTRGAGGLYRNFFAAIFADIGNALTDGRDIHEGDVVTTLEPEVETRLVKDLEKINSTYTSSETGGIIMDPRTGAIIAMATFPTYDANDYSDEPISILTNSLVSHVYEFGSIMKPLTMAAALDAGVVTPATTYNDTGCMTLDTSKICNFDHKARGVIPMQEILSQSLNMGAAFLAGKLGADHFRTYFTHLGFGEKTGIDLPAETSGLVKNLESPRQIEFATAAFGQGIAVTPIEMIRALGALANDGALTRPHLVSAIKLDTGITKPLDWSVAPDARVFSPESTRAVSQMLTYVVDHNLSHGTLAIKNLSVAAKTGTAQLTTAEGGYHQDRYFHSFFGYFPSYDPRFIILLYTNDPKGVQYASETLTGTFMDLVHFLSDYYDIPPDREAITAP